MAGKGRRLKVSVERDSKWVRFRHRYLPRRVRCYVSVHSCILVYLTRGGYPIRAVSWDWRTASAESQRCEIWPQVETLFMKRKSVEVPAQPNQVVQDPEMLKSHPNLYAFLTDTVWEDEKGISHRELGSVIIWADQAGFRAKLLDRDGSRSALVLGTSWSKLIDACEAALQDVTTTWKGEAPPVKNRRR